MGDMAVAMSLNYSILGALRRHHGVQQQKDSPQDPSVGLFRAKQVGGHPLPFHYDAAHVKLERRSGGH